MTDKPNDLLLLAAKVLTVFLQIAMGMAAAFLVLAIPMLFIFQGEINSQIASEHGDAVMAFPALTMAALFALILGLLGLGFVFFGKLRAIVSTVGEGDPFAHENANRLNLMGWIAVGTQIVMIPIVGLVVMVADWAEPMENAEIDIDPSFDIEGILLAIILFILARVFKHGAAMRDDLEGTV